MARPSAEDEGQVDGRPERADGPRGRGATIGAVCQTLRQEFPDISISKIRYLEDQRLITPQRTSGGYRLYSQTDIDRLRAILRMQRDEFLPLRVIRQELAAGRGSADNAVDRGRETSSSEEPREPRHEGQRTSNVSVLSKGSFHLRSDILNEPGTDEKLLRELIDFGLITGKTGADGPVFDDAEREIILVAAALSRYGIGARHLRTFRSSADREAGLLQQLLGPSLQSRNPERRKEAVDVLDDLAVTVSRLSHLLLVRDLRRLTD
ncbi:MAG: MerR family transcriptional regulator [Solirubrobacteraceae bacterium]|nr:MerR family transcriptional regulator [Solirubrobacteraceae bacterium]